LATEEGIITKIEAATAWAKTTRSSSCASCSSRGSCNAMEDGGKEMIVEVYNPAGAKVGDRVVLSFETSSLLKAYIKSYGNFVTLSCSFGGFTFASGGTN